MSQAGDSRANEQLELTVLHTIWLRQHNRVADELAKINSHWDDERLYQETRRIIGAQLQHITYNEYLPLLLGFNDQKRTENLRKFNTREKPVPRQFDESKVNKHDAHLKLLELSRQLELEEGSNFYHGYDINVDASLSNVIASAAFRFGHTQVKGEIQLNHDRFIPLHLTFFNPGEIYTENGIDSVIRGATSQRSAVVGPYVSRELTEHLFQPNDQFYGLDLQALSIQRGRDHGLAPYVKWVQHCFGHDKPIKTWKELKASGLITDKEKIKFLKSHYKTPETIDLLVGGLLEDMHLNEDAILPVTISCIMGEQFARTRKGTSKLCIL